MSKKTTLVIMAAGIGSRFGGGIKQLESVGPNGEIIMDYSVFDAIEAGFDKVVFIIRKDIEKDFKEIIGDRISKYVKTEYVFQDTDVTKYGHANPEGRTKPWGTGNAVLAAKDAIEGSFLVINADDFYGKQGYKAVHDYLTDDANDHPGAFCMAGFILGNTLSDSGTVKRGVCTTDENGYLIKVEECTDLIAVPEGVSGTGLDGRKFVVSPNTPVSMNMFGFTHEFLDELEEGFKKFLKNLDPEKETTAEFYLPSMVTELIENGKARMQVLPTPDKWIGVTYKEDKPFVVQSIRELVEKGVYSEKLFN